MMKIQPFFILFVVIILSITACQSQSDYDRLVRQGMNLDAKNDSLFLGYYLGMTRKDFFDHSWSLNQEGKVLGDTRVHYKTEALKSSATMSFYPEFKNNRIVKMPVEVSYDAWAPWNRQFSSDSLAADLVEHYKEIYQTAFTHVYVPELGKNAWVSVEGNREIRISAGLDRGVSVEFIDLQEKENEEDR